MLKIESTVLATERWMMVPSALIYLQSSQQSKHKKPKRSLYAEHSIAPLQCMLQAGKILNSKPVKNFLFTVYAGLNLAGEAEINTDFYDLNIIPLLDRAKVNKHDICN
jgi:hypothetical protein